MKKILSVCILAVCVAISANCFASAPATPQAAEQKGKEMADQMKQMVYTGVVKKHEDGTALITKDKTYPLEGGDFAMIVGKEVDIVGKIVKEGDVEKLVVSKLQVLKK